MEKQKIGIGFKLKYSTKTAAVCVLAAMMGYTTLYATNYMGLDPAAVGMVFMISKIFDGFTDLIAGVIIDHTHTKLGQARPYELALIGYGAAMILLFSAPDLSEHAGLVYLFVMYTLVNSVFSTLTSCNDAPYLSNALERSEDSVHVVAFGSLVSLFFTVIAAILVPQMIKTIGVTKEGWSLISIVLIVPTVAVGLIRFLTIKEIRVSSVTKKGEKRNLTEDLRCFAKNKYIIIFGLILLISNICANISNMNYYYIYIMNDIGLASLMSLSIFGVIVILIIMPKLSKKFGMGKVMLFCTITGTVGYMIKLIAPTNIVVVLISCLLSNFAYTPIWFMANSVLIDIMDYGEWKFQKRVQGVYSSVSGIASKLGTAFGSGLLGVLMGMSGFDGKQAVQSEGAMHMILALSTYIPALICVVMTVLCIFYDLDKKLPRIREDIRKRNTDR